MTIMHLQISTAHMDIFIEATRAHDTAQLAKRDPTQVQRLNSKSRYRPP